MSADERQGGALVYEGDRYYEKRFAPRDQVHRLKPDAHGNFAVLKDGADLHGEGFPALVALVGAHPRRLALHLADAIYPAAMGAHGTVRPNPRLNVSVGRFFVMKVGADKFDMTGSVQCQQPISPKWVRQV